MEIENRPINNRAVRSAILFKCGQLHIVNQVLNSFVQLQKAAYAEALSGKDPREAIGSLAEQIGGIHSGLDELRVKIQKEATIQILDEHPDLEGMLFSMAYHPGQTKEEEARIELERIRKPLHEVDAANDNKESDSADTN